MNLSYRGLVVAVVAVLAVLAVGSAMALLHYSLYVDQANFVELIDTTFQYGVPLTRLTKSLLEEMLTIASQDVPAVCQMPLPLDHGPMMNIFVWHSYPILYLIAPLRWLFDGRTIVAALTALSFVGMIVIIFVVARRRRVPLLAALSFAFLVTAHPAWSHAMFWQFYTERLLMVIGLLYAITLLSYLEEDEPSSAWLVLMGVTGLLATACTERAGIMISGFTFGCLLLFRGLHYRRLDLVPATIALAAAVYVFLYMRFFQSNEWYGSFSSTFISRAVEILRHGLDAPSEKFLLINALGLGLLACFRWRLALVVAVLMLPNLLGTLGGVEKTGFYSHYHTLYFTFLVAAALYGLIRLHRNFPGRVATLSASAGMVASGIVLVLINSDEPKPLVAFSLSNLDNYAPLKVARMITDTQTARGFEQHKTLVLAAAAKVPPGSSVSTVQAMTPALYDEKAALHISVYPLGLDEVDYLVLPYQRGSDGQLVLSGADSFLGPEAREKLNACINERSVRLGFHPLATIPAVLGATWGLVVLHRE